jgi:adenylosuccinate synthase
MRTDALKWVANNNPHPAIRGVATAMTVSFGTISAFIASWTYTSPNAPQYVVGHALNLAFSLGAIAGAAMLWVYCSQENKKRDRGLRDQRLHGLSRDQIGLLSHRHPTFRYAV